jgi:hypothetical protein
MHQSGTRETFDFGACMRGSTGSHERKGSLKEKTIISEDTSKSEQTKAKPTMATETGSTALTETELDKVAGGAGSKFLLGIKLTSQGG